MIFSKCIADHIRENLERDTVAFKLLYSLAVVVRVIELLALALFFWFVAVVILSI